MYILALDAALARCSAAVLHHDTVVSLRQVDAATGHASVLPKLTDEVLAEAGWPRLAFVAVTVGPGSFTGLRAALALAHGIGLGAGIPVVGVTVAEALAAGVAGIGQRALWVAIDSRRSQVFLDRNGVLDSHALDSLPLPPGPIAVAGDAAVAVAAALAARGCDVLLTDAGLPCAADVAHVGLRRWRGDLPDIPAQPLYIHPPAVRLPGPA
jgi:tRNA threonylcarbamoyladenosine biosynthesis protein TsaB